MPLDLTQFADVDATPETPAAEPERGLGKRVNLAEFSDIERGERPGPQTAGQHFGQGIVSGVNQLQASMYGLVSLAGASLGSKSLNDFAAQQRANAESGRGSPIGRMLDTVQGAAASLPQALSDFAAEGLEETQKDAENFAPTIGSLSDIEDTGDFFDWAASTVGQQVPQLAAMFGSGGIGGALAKAATRTALRRGATLTARRQLMRQFGTVKRGELNTAIARQMASPATQRLLRQSFSRGAGSRAAGTSFGIQAGDLQNQLTEAGIDSPLTAVVGGAAAAVLDAAPVAVLLDRVFPGVDRALSKSFVQDIAKTMGIQGALEGGTEAAQELVMLASRAYHDPTFDITSPANRKQILDAAAAGALVGGLTGGAGEVASIAPRQTAKTVKRARAEGSRLASMVDARVQLARSAATASAAQDSAIPGMGEFREATTSFFKEAVGPVLTGANERLMAGARDALGALNSPDLGLNLSGMARSLDEKIQKNVSPLIGEALSVMHRQIDAVRAQAATIAEGDRAQWLTDQLSKIKGDIKNFIDQRVAPIVKGAEDELAKEVGTANYDDPDLDASAYDDDPDELVGPLQSETIEFEETRIGPSGQPFKRTVVAEEPQRAARTIDRDATVIDDPVRIRFGQNVEKTRTARNKDGSLSTETYSVRARGDDAVAFGNRAAAERELAKIRENLPNISEDAFVIEEAETGGFLIGIQDAGQAESLWSQVKFNEALTEARISARMSKDESRRIEIRKRNADGWTRIDLPSLVIAGKRLVEASGGALPEHYGRATQAGLDAALAQLIDAGFEIRGLRGKVVDRHGTTIPDLRKLAKEKTEKDIPTIAELQQRNPGVPEEELVKLQERMLEQQKQREQLAELGPTELEIPSDARSVASTITTEETVEKTPGTGGSTAPEFKLVRRGNRRTSRIGVADPQTQTAEELGRETDDDQARASARVRGPSKQSTASELGAVDERQVRVSIEKAAEAAEIKEYVERVAKLAGLKNRIAVVDQVGLQKLIDANHPLADVLAKAGARNEDRAWGWITAQNDDVVIYLRDDTIADPLQRMATLTHELGHMVEFVYFRQITDPKLREALYKGHAAYLDKGGKKIFEEWMADQFVGWIIRADKEPKTTVERFFHRVAIILRGIIDVVKKKYGLAGSYKQFADGIAAVAAKRGQDSNPYAQHFLNEGVVGRVHFNNPYQGTGSSSASDIADRKLRKRMDEIPADRPRTEIDAKAQAEIAKVEAEIEAKINILLKIEEGDFSVLGITEEDFGPADFQKVAKFIEKTEAEIERLQARLSNLQKRDEITPTMNFDVPEMKAGLRAKVSEILDKYPGAKQAGVRLLETMGWLHDNLISSLNGQVRRMGIPAADKLMDMFNRTPGAERQNPTYFNNVQLHLARFATKFNTALKTLDDAKKATVLKELIAGKPTSLEAVMIADTFEDFFKYLRDAGLPIKEVKNYFPRIWDPELVRAQSDAIVAKLMELGASSAEADGMVARMAQTGEADTDATELLIDLPASGFLQQREKLLNDPFFQQFQSKDLDRTIERYLSSAVKRAEFNRFLGEPKRQGKQWNPEGNLERILKEAKEQGATKEQLKKMVQAVDAMLGRHGRDSVPPGVRQAMAWIATYQNVRLLLFSTLSAFPDIIGPAIRSNDFKTAWSSLRNNWSELVSKQSDLTEMARTWGIISDTLNQHVLTEHFDNHWFPERARRINEKFFRAIGLERWTNFTRAAALAVGRDAIKRWAADGKAQELGELGLTVSDVQQWMDAGEPTFGAHGYNSDEGPARKIAEALVQFVNESVMRPNPSQRPLWASNPAFMLLFHLKSFMYAFHDTISRRLYLNFQKAGTPWQKAMVVAGPAAMMMALTAAGLELRELIQYKLWGMPAPTDNQGSVDYVFNLATRSGIFGVSQLAIDWEGANERGQVPLMAISGPTIQQLNDIMSKPLSQTVPKAIPGVSQLPPVRQALRDLTPL